MTMQATSGEVTAGLVLLAVLASAFVSWMRSRQQRQAELEAEANMPTVKELSDYNIWRSIQEGYSQTHHAASGLAHLNALFDAGLDRDSAVAQRLVADQAHQELLAANERKLMEGYEPPQRVLDYWSKFKPEVDR